MGLAWTAPPSSTPVDYVEALTTSVLMLIHLPAPRIKLSLGTAALPKMQELAPVVAMRVDAVGTSLSTRGPAATVRLTMWQ